MRPWTARGEAESIGESHAPKADDSDGGLREIIAEYGKRFTDHKPSTTPVDSGSTLEGSTPQALILPRLPESDFSHFRVNAYPRDTSSELILPIWEAILQI